MNTATSLIPLGMGGPVHVPLFAIRWLWLAALARIRRGSYLLPLPGVTGEGAKLSCCAKHAAREEAPRPKRGLRDVDGMIPPCRYRQPSRASRCPREGATVPGGKIEIGCLARPTVPGGIGKTVARRAARLRTRRWRYKEANPRSLMAG